jgi:hypothetical protein
MEKAPVTAQPTAAGPGALTPMPMPTGVEGVPPGLEYLTQVDQLLIHQLIEMLEVLTGFETENKYVIKNAMGQQVYFAAESSDCLERQCCGPARAFSMAIIDNFQREVIHLERPFRCGHCCCPCHLNELQVQSPPGNVIGYVNEIWTCCYPEFNITDAAGTNQFFIHGPVCPCKCYHDVEFPILTADRAGQIGTLTSQWSGCAQECVTDAGNFSVTFPMGAPWQTKVLLLASAFLVDFMFYEKSNNNNR